MYVCPSCERPINQATEICPYCETDLISLRETLEAEPPKKANPIAMLARWGVLLIAVWAFLWLIMPERAVDQRLQAEQVTVEALQQVQSALSGYLAAQGSFPDSLEALGDRVRIAAQQAQGQGYRLVYTPGHAAPDGRTLSYTLEARAGNYGYRSFYTDESGVLRATREQRPANALDPPL